MPIAKLSVDVRPHALQVDGISDYSIVTFTIDVETKRYYKSSSIYSAYILQSQDPKSLLDIVITTLKYDFIQYFDLDKDELDYVDYDLDILLDKIKKYTLDNI